MEISDNLLCLFSAQVEEQDGSYVVEVPEQEISQGIIEGGEMYRIAMLSAAAEGTSETESSGAQQRDAPEPPVQEGDIREVEIEDIGQQGDGIARVERGYVIIVPDAEKGERVTIEITNVRENVAFSEVIERNDPQ